MSVPLLLASRSPRRAELLRLLGVAFDLVDVEVNETPAPGEAAADYVLRVAQAKAEAGRAASGGHDAAVLAADTTVALDGRLFGKPRDAAEAAAMLGALSGRRHRVYTAIAILAPRANATRVVVTTVEFATLDAGLVAAYCASGEPADKAGAYGIQGLGGALVRRLDGSYGAVVGLPLVETRELLDLAGVAHALTSR